MLRKVWSAVFILVMLFSCNNLSVFAQEENQVEQLECQVMEWEVNSNLASRSTTFIDTTITTNYDAEGMHVTIFTCMNNVAYVVGVKDIEIQVKSGNDWITVAVSSGGELYNTSACAVNINYSGVEVGKTYRVTCVHYGNVDEYRELYHETDGFKCQY